VLDGRLRANKNARTAILAQSRRIKTSTSGMDVSTFFLVELDILARLSKIQNLDCPRKFLLSAFWSWHFHLKEQVLRANFDYLFFSSFFTGSSGRSRWKFLSKSSDHAFLSEQLIGLLHPPLISITSSNASTSLGK
jgi:hypothetical protein